MNTTQAQKHFLDMLQKLRVMERSPWPFLCAAAMLEYLAKMAIGNGRQAYIRFINQYMKQEYRNFQFANGKKDLADQVYYVLRCGLVHSFSLTPDDKQKSSTGRKESIVITHDGSHLTAYFSKDSHHQDAVCLVFKDFADDIEAALTKLFSDAQTDAVLKANMESHLSKSPPIVVLQPVMSPTIPFLTSSVMVSGSVHI